MRAKRSAASVTARWTPALRLSLKMLHNRAAAIDAARGVPGFAIPNAPAQALDPLDNHNLRLGPSRIINRQVSGDLLQVLETCGDMEPNGDAGIGESAPGARVAVGRRSTLCPWFS